MLVLAVCVKGQGGQNNPFPIFHPAISRWAPDWSISSGKKPRACATTWPWLAGGFLSKSKSALIEQAGEEGTFL